MSQRDSQDYVDIPPTEVEAPNTHGKFSLGEDWWATIAGITLVVLCLVGVVPNIGGWFS